MLVLIFKLLLKLVPCRLKSSKLSPFLTGRKYSENFDYRNLLSMEHISLANYVCQAVGSSSKNYIDHYETHSV